MRESIEDELLEVSIYLPNSPLVPADQGRTIRGLRNLLENLQSYLIEKGQKLVILMDEMETLSRFRQGTVIAEELCKTAEYTEMIFVYTGSYLWKDHVNERGSLFNHLEPHFLKSITEEDVRSFLLQPLANESEKDFVIQMSGCKPLYTQYIAEIIHESDKEVTQYDLLENQSLCQKVKQNIFEEHALDQTSKLLLSTLSHYKDVPEEWLAQKLKLDPFVVRNKLSNFLDFGTISSFGEKYRICGEFIELYGRQSQTNPIQEEIADASHTKTLIHLLKWDFLPILFIGSILINRHIIDPGYSQKKFLFKGNVILEISYPKLLESNEKGVVNVFVSNSSQSKIDSLKFTFDSTYIKYSKDGKNALVLSDIEPGDTYSEELGFHVISVPEKEKIESRVAYLGQYFFFEIERRPFSIKPIGKYISAFLAILNLVVPGKNWIGLFAKIQKILLPEEGQSDHEEN